MTVPAGLSANARRAYRDAHLQIEGAIDYAERLTDHRIEGLLRRLDIPVEPDGLPRMSIRDPSRVGAAKFDPDDVDPVHLTATEAAADARMRGMLDEVGEKGRRILAELHAAYASLRTAHDLLASLEAGTPVVVEPEPMVDCQACLQSVRRVTVKSAYCPPCHATWCNYGRPDRVLFEAWRQEKREEVPPPSQGCTARRGPYKAAP